MSIFSRLFNKTPESEGKEPTEDGADAGDLGEKERMRPSVPTKGAASGSMRPEAPPFKIHAPAEAAAIVSPTSGKPSEARASKAAPAPPVERRALSPQSAPQAPRDVRVQSADARGAGRSSGNPTVKMGTNAPLGGVVPQGAAAPMSATAPPSSAGPLKNGSPPAPAAAFAPGAAGTTSAARAPLGSRPKFGKEADPPGKLPTARVAEPRESPVDGLLTLELGVSQSPSFESNSASKSQASKARPLAQPRPAERARPLDEPKPAAPPNFGRSSEPEASLFSDLDAAFGAIVDAGVRAGANANAPSLPSGGSNGELRDLFTALAANHMRQVRDFMIAIKWGDAPCDWIPICEPAVVSLQRAAKEMELTKLGEALEGYAAALARVASRGGATVSGDGRDDLMRAYAPLAEEMPDAFGLEGERGRREAIIVHALLQQVPEVRKVTIDKIYAAGLTSLDTLFLAKPDEISATTGIGESVASSIVDKFQRYKREIAALADANRAAERRRLGELCAEMRDLHTRFDRASSEWSDEASKEKKMMRQARAEVLLQVKVLLARLGEVERLGKIERLPFERKIEELDLLVRELEQAP